MSHWKKFNSNVLENTNKDLLQVALKEMDLTMDTSINSIRNTWGNETVDAGLVKNGSPISLGFNFTKNEEGVEQLELTGDFYSTGLNERGFIDKLAQVYQKHNIVDKCEQQGWSIDEINVDDTTGEIVIEAYQWA